MGNKKFFNANKILPENLVKEIQKYIEGAYLYIPKKDRKAWGLGTGIREELDLRNEQIVNGYNNGMEIHLLAKKFYLSEERIRAIVFGYVYPSTKEQEVGVMLPGEQFDKEKAKKIFSECVKNNSLYIEYVDTMYLKVYNEDLEDTLTFYYSTTYSDAELRDALRILAKELGTTLNQRICLRQTKCRLSS